MKSVNDESGFSLMEMMVSLSMLTIVMGIAFTLISNFQQTYRYEESFADAQRNARFAMSRLNEVIRTAGTNPTGDMLVNQWIFVEYGNSGSFPTGAGALSQGNSLHLRSDLNGDKQSSTTIVANSDVIVTSENVTLQFDQTNRRIVIVDLNAPTDSASVPLADNISGLTFSDPDGTRRAVQVQLVATPNGITPGDPRYREVAYTSTIRLRNRR